MPTNKYDAVILAGGVSPWLQQVAGTPYRAWAGILGKPMALWIAAALLDSGKVARVLVAGPDIPVPCALPLGVDVITCGATLMDTVDRAVAHLATQRKIIFVTDDIPMLQSAAVQDFVVAAENLQADVCYSIVPRQAVEAAFPAARRTYVKIREGHFTGGNIFLVDPKVMPTVRRQVEEVFARRKNILGLCRWLGFGFILKYILGTATLASLEARVSTLFGFSGRAVITQHASIGMDVDKIEDWRLAEKFLQGQAEEKRGNDGQN